MHIEGFQPRIVGIGGTPRPGSSSEKALRYALSLAEERGAITEIFTGDEIQFPVYMPEAPARTVDVMRMIDALRASQAIIIASPGYHGSVSGLVKNALDYAEDLRNDALPYFEGRAVGVIACADGWQAALSTLAALRDLVHALRGWPTPLGVAFNTTDKPFTECATPSDPALAQQLKIMTEQVLDFASMRYLARAGATAK